MCLLLEVQVLTEKRALLLQNLKLAKGIKLVVLCAFCLLNTVLEYCLSLKKQLFRKDIELSRKVTDIKNKESNTSE